MNNIFKEIQKRGYQVYHKRILGNPLYTSEETRRKDLIQELALVVDWINEKFKIFVYVEPRLNSWIFGAKNTSNSNNYELIIDIKVDFYESNDYLISKGIPTIMKTPQEATIAAIEYLIENKLI